MPIALKGWDAVASEIEDDGTVHKICIGTMCTEDVNYYMNRPFSMMIHMDRLPSYLQV